MMKRSFHSEEYDVNKVWKYLPHTLAVHLSGGKWKPFSYLVKISHLIAEAVAEGNRKIIITAPPRHGKSELCSQYVPVWFLTNWPYKHVLLASYGAELATKFGRWCRNTISGHADELGVNISLILHLFLDGTQPPVDPWSAWALEVPLPDAGLTL